MTIFINHPLHVGYSSTQYGTGVLQTAPLKLLTKSSEPRHTALQYHIVWCYYVALIPFAKTKEKVLATSALSPQKD
jgi:hypothetical protein